MTTGALVWLILFAISALLFFVIALVVTVRGVSDLRELLSDSDHPSRTDGSLHTPR
jgi:hypothetical protein